MTILKKMINYIKSVFNRNKYPELRTISKEEAEIVCEHINNDTETKKAWKTIMLSLFGDRMPHSYKYNIWYGFELPKVITHEFLNNLLYKVNNDEDMPRHQKVFVTKIINKMLEHNIDYPIKKYNTDTEELMNKLESFITEISSSCKRE